LFRFLSGSSWFLEPFENPSLMIIIICMYDGCIYDVCRHSTEILLTWKDERPIIGVLILMLPGRAVQSCPEPGCAIAFSILASVARKKRFAYTRR